MRDTLAFRASGSDREMRGVCSKTTCGGMDAGVDALDGGGG